MGYYIFNTLEAAQAYNDACVVAHNHHDSTQRWANVQKHPTLNKWAITASAAVDVQSEMVDSLSSDWTLTELI